MLTVKQTGKLNNLKVLGISKPMGLDEVAEIAAGGRLTLDLGRNIYPREKQHIHLWIGYN